MRSTTPVNLEHARLRALATHLKGLHPDDTNILWLVTALNRIGSGTDANEALGIKRGKGHDAKKAEAHYLTQVAIRWIAGRMNLENETPPKKRVAIEEAATAFGLEVDNLTRACPSIKKLTQIATFSWDSQRPRLQKPGD